MSQTFISRAILAVIVESAVLVTGLVWTYSVAGISISNASGNVIRSSILSPYAAFLPVVLTALLSSTISLHWLRKDKRLRKVSLMATMLLFVASMPFLIYFNFYYSTTELISGTIYIVYPYAVQTGIPLVLSGYAAFMIGIFSFPKFKVRIGRFDSTLLAGRREWKKLK